MAYIEFEITPVGGGHPYYTESLREVIEYCNDKMYEEFYIVVNTDYDYEKVIDKVQNEIWSVFNLSNVREIS